jgi:hypothetical protein
MLKTRFGQFLRGEATADQVQAETMQPATQAAYEQTAEAVARSSAAEKYWEKSLRGSPRSMFDVPMIPHDQAHRLVRIGMRSPAVALAATLISRRVRRSTSSVLLAATAAMLGTLTEHDSAVLQLIVGNRFDAARRSLVAVLSQDGLFTLPMGGRTFDDLVEQSYRNALDTYRYGFYDFERIMELRRRIAVERGVHLDLGAYFNDVRIGQDQWDELVQGDETADSLGRLAEESAFFPLGTWARQDAKFFMTVKHEPGACQLHLLIDTAYLPRALMEPFLRGMEKLLIHAALQQTSFDEVAGVTGMAVIRRPPHWARTLDGWVDLHATRALVAAVTGSPAVRISTRPTGHGGEGRLIAQVPPGEYASPDLAAGCHRRVGERTDVVVPHGFVLRTDRSADGT